MANRFQSPNEEFVDSAGAPYAGGFLYFYASGTTTPLNTYSDSSLAVANANPVELDSAGRAGDIFLQNLAYKVVLKDSDGNTIWTKDPVYTSDYSAFGQFKVNAGNPNGSIAGTAGSGSIPSSVIWDSTNNILYVCTTTGSTSTAVWTAVNATTSNPTLPQPQGYLTLSSGTPVITTDVAAATTVYYALDAGNLIPIYNGSTMVPTTFTELSLSLVASHAASQLYDVFVFSNSGVPTAVTGPAWSTPTAGAGARGTGAGTTQLGRVQGIYTNAVQITGRNGSSTYTVAANQGTYVGTLYMDGTNGQITCHVGWGVARKWGVWNAYNRRILHLRGGDSTASWAYNVATIRQSNAGATNSVTPFTGLADETVRLEFLQRTSNGTSSDANFDDTMQIGIGVNSTTVMSGTAGSHRGAINDITSPGIFHVGIMNTARHYLTPTLGINNCNALELGAATVNVVHTFFGTEANMVLSATYRG